jgi:hypothetical protein
MSLYPPPAPPCSQTSWIFHHGQRPNIEDHPPLFVTKFRIHKKHRQGYSCYKLFQYFWRAILQRKTWTLSGTTSGRIRAFRFSAAFQHGIGPNQPLSSRNSSPPGKTRGLRTNSPLSRAKVKNPQGYASTSPQVFIKWCLITHSGSWSYSPLQDTTHKVYRPKWKDLHLRDYS